MAGRVNVTDAAACWVVMVTMGACVKASASLALMASQSTVEIWGWVIPHILFLVWKVFLYCIL